MDYILNPADALSLIIDIHISTDLSSHLGNAKLPNRNYGPSGQKFRTLISELNAMTAAGYSYHEIGIYRGRTLLTSAVDNPTVKHIGVDNFSQFDKDGENEAAIRDTILELSIPNVELECGDYIDFYTLHTDLNKRDCGVFFYDAIHDYRNQLLGLMFGSRIVAPGGILLIDDTNYGHVRQSTYDFMRANPEYKLIFETFTGMHPAKMDADTAAVARDNWWNGTQVLVFDPDNRIDTLSTFREDVVEQAFARAVSQTSAECEHLPTRFLDEV